MSKLTSEKKEEWQRVILGTYESCTAICIATFAAMAARGMAYAELGNPDISNLPANKCNERLSEIDLGKVAAKFRNVSVDEIANGRCAVTADVQFVEGMKPAHDTPYTFVARARMSRLGIEIITYDLTFKTDKRPLDQSWREMYGTPRNVIEGN